MKKAFPLLDAGTAAKEVEIVQTLAITADAKQHGLGYLSPAKITLTKNVMVKTYNIKTDVPINDTFSNEFLPK